MIHWTSLWIHLFGTTHWLGLDIGFWVSISLCIVVVLLMNVVLWNLAKKKES